MDSHLRFARFWCHRSHYCQLNRPSLHSIYTFVHPYPLPHRSSKCGDKWTQSSVCWCFIPSVMRSACEQYLYSIVLSSWHPCYCCLVSSTSSEDVVYLFVIFYSALRWKLYFFLMGACPQQPFWPSFTHLSKKSCLCFPWQLLTIFTFFFDWQYTKENWFGCFK